MVKVCGGRRDRHSTRKRNTGVSLKGALYREIHIPTSTNILFTLSLSFSLVSCLVLVSSCTPPHLVPPIHHEAREGESGIHGGDAAAIRHAHKHDDKKLRVAGAKRKDRAKNHLVQLTQHGRAHVMRTWRRRGEDEQFEYLPSKYMF